MNRTEQFKNHLAEGQQFKKDYLILGTGILDGQPVDGAQVKIPTSNCRATFSQRRAFCFDGFEG